MTARLLVSCCVALSVFGFGVFAGGAYAGSLEIFPMLVEVPPESTVATYTLRNSGSQELGVQVKAFRWQQEADGDAITAAENLMIVPSIVSIPAGQEQLVRVALRAPRPSHELSYRLHFQELPASSPQGVPTVQTLLKIDVPLFFVAEQVSDQYEPRLLAQPESQVTVEIANTGSRYLRFTRLQLLSQNELVGELRGPLYVLPGARRQWTLELNPPHASDGKKDRYELELVSGRNREKHLLEVE